MNNVLKDLIRQFVPFAQEKIGFEKPPRLFLKHDSENAKNPLGRTAFYDPAERAVTLYVTDRHPKDILRSLGHELVHHKQNCDGMFDDIEPSDMGEGYAQTHPGLRDMEIAANRDGSMALRDFEDRLKTENTIYYEHLQKGEQQMSTKDWKNGELTTILSEAFGFKFNLDALNEGKDYDDPGASGTGSSPTGNPEDEVKAGKKETKGTEKSKRRVDEEEAEGLEEIVGAALAAPAAAGAAGLGAAAGLGGAAKLGSMAVDKIAGARDDDEEDEDDDESDECAERDQEEAESLEEANDMRLREEKVRAAIREAVRLYKEKVTMKGKSKN